MCTSGNMEVDTDEKHIFDENTDLMQDADFITADA
jgi:hypothetical protein